MSKFAKNYQDKFIREWFNQDSKPNHRKMQKIDEEYQALCKEMKQKHGTTDLREAKDIQSQNAWKQTLENGNK